MKGFGRFEWTAAVTGTLLFVVAIAVLPLVLERMGMSPRAAAGHALTVVILVGPAGVLAMGAGGLIGQTLRLPGWTGSLLLVAIPSIVNGLVWGGVAKGITWGRVHARILFWTLVVAVGIWCTLGVAVILMMRH